MGVSELEESCLSLDEKLLGFMEQLDVLEQKRAALNSLIEQGWFTMSKARYSMGNKQVCALQYASEMEPLVCVHARKLDDGNVEFSTERVTQSKESEKDVRLIEDIGPQEKGVRRRNKPQKDITEKGANDKPSSEKATEATPVKQRDHSHQQDPLKWFGILVPQSLKQAQSAFKQVIELSAEIATLQTAILNTKQELRNSMKHKHVLQEEISAAQLDKAVN
ncbi:vacuolar ATPase assembly protein VMA22 [Echeneis naucrates]|uniref:Vacuolar ATPase assembly protein VMA22 n=1 Tax=Echeneis naucrates TaxID=173247 RepID=A0A665U4Q5_ECHNA|nr:coiled-coil domain-containing protein 115 [Echeneis naucrates]